MFVQRGAPCGIRDRPPHRRRLRGLSPPTGLQAGTYAAITGMSIPAEPLRNPSRPSQLPSRHHDDCPGSTGMPGRETAHASVPPVLTRVKPIIFPRNDDQCNSAAPVNGSERLPDPVPSLFPNTTRLLAAGASTTIIERAMTWLQGSHAAPWITSDPSSITRWLRPLATFNTESCEPER
jgi:hypothetical protein